MEEINNNIGALYAFDIYPSGAASQLDPDKLSKNIPDVVSYRWVHLDLEHEGTQRWIAAQTDDVVAQALTLDDTRPRSVAHANGVLLKLRGVNMNPASDPEDMVSLRI